MPTRLCSWKPLIAIIHLSISRILLGVILPGNTISKQTFNPGIPIEYCLDSSFLDPGTNPEFKEEIILRDYCVE